MSTNRRKENSFAPAIDANLNVLVEMPQSFSQPKRRGVRLLTILILCVFIVLLAVAVLFLANPYAANIFMDLYPRGNTYANLSCGGFAAESGGWIYLSDNQNGENGLYKVNLETKEAVLLAGGDSDIFSSINVSGDWVYYISGEGASAALYKVPVKGGDSVLIKKDCIQAILFGDWLYGMNNSNEAVKIKTNGTLKTLDSGITSLLYVRRNNVYAMIEQNNVISVVLILPKGGHKILLTNLNDAVSDGEAIYATEKSNDSAYSLLHKENAISGNASIFTGLYNLPFVTKDWLYANSEDGIWRMNKDGSEATKISGDQYTAINSAGDWLIYRSESSGKLMKMKPDGSELSAFWEGTTLSQN